MLVTVGTFDMPLPNVICLHLTRTEAFDIALAELAAGDIAAVADGQIEFADVLGCIVATLSALGRAGRKIATEDVAVVTAVAAAVVGI
jgi:hypothetical protein